MREIENLKRAILEEYPRLTADDTFKFNCRPGVSCFNECCGDVNIFLTPYDILRMKNRLGISSEEFLDNYTITPIDKNQNYPVILLKMQDNEGKTCHFVGSEGCTIYEDRPWACRYYPVGLASPKEGENDSDEDFYFILKEDVCKGFAEGDTEWTIGQWRTDQGLEAFDEFGKLYKEITLHDYFTQGKQLDVPRMELFHMACYNLDKFRYFIKESTFLQRFDLEEGLIDKIMVDDEELLRFGFRWLKFALFAEKTIDIKPSALSG
ncbi:zinc/iron-chelating domain-containing protein [candidate division LCP-89 bacterium B3_LCP]|uniref:Zinc/iron-chelating domain-containing protein n=1 Tax=candidate division LCP-89 bacterium B3_LCP TaxID=2012998 RepID=A0A532V0R1_UNCL8|nr:MAG: zinc/iron-chelating domain-containing protein [candidate division LCP-89 bacterium B3_LCP]